METPDEDAFVEAAVQKAEHLGELQRWELAERTLAEALARRALALDPGSEYTHGLLATVLVERKQRRVGRRHADASVALAPDDGFPHVARGHALLASGRPFAARRHLREALRIDPSDQHTEALFLEADRCCRWLHLPMYHWSLNVDRLPGKQCAVWGLFVVPVLLSRSEPGLDRFLDLILFPYLALLIYTWVATPLVAAWVRLVPPR